jgi:hypothetical protein
MRMCIKTWLKKGGWEVKGYGRVIEGVEQTKIKHFHSGDTERNPYEHQLKY